MIRYIILLLFFGLPLCGLQAQEFTLSGRVVATNESPIELASVSCLSQGKATMTDLKGRFSLTLHSADSVAIKFSMIGYKSKIRILRRPRGRPSSWELLRRYWLAAPLQVVPTDYIRLNQV